MPMKPPVACSYMKCSNTVVAGKGGLCEIHRKQAYKEYAKTRDDKEAIAIYSSKKWKLARKQALFRDDGWCVHCKEVPADLVDHIKEIKDGGSPYDLDNLQSLCKSCHNKKTF